MISKQIGQSTEYYLMYEILRKLGQITKLAPYIGWGIDNYSLIMSVAVSVNENQTVGVPVQITAVPLAHVTDWSWEIRDSVTDTLIDSSTSQNWTSTINTIGAYDLILIASNPADVYPRRFRRSFYVHTPRVSWEECDYTVDWDANPDQDFFFDFDGIDMSGKVIGIRGSSSPGRYFSPYRCKASNPLNKGIVQTFGDVLIDGNGIGNHTFWFQGDCENIIVNGYKEDGTRGLTIENTTSGSQLCRANGRFTGLQFFGVTFNHSSTIEGATLSLVPRNAVDSQASNWTVDNIVVYDCIINNGGDESAYLGENNQHVTTFIPPQFINCVVARNVFNGSGRDNLQAGGLCNFEIHNNYFSDWGKQMDIGGQTSAFSHNAGSFGKFYANIGSGGELFWNIQSGPFPWNINAGQTVPQDSYYFGNVFWNGEYTGWDDPDEPFSVYIQNYTNSGSSGPWNIHIFHNSLPSDKGLIERFYHYSSFPSSRETIINNAMVITGGSGTTPEYNYNGSSGDGIPLRTAQCKTTGNITLSGEQIIDGYVTNFSFVLVGDQNNPIENGYYTTQGVGAWIRNTDADTDAELQTLQVFVENGIVNTNTLWYQSTENIEIGVTDITFDQTFTNTLINNIVREVGDEADIMFQSYVSPNNASDLNISSFDSVVYGGSPTDIVARLPELDTKYLYDYMGFPLNVPGYGYTFGAYSGYQKRLITP